MSGMEFSRTMIWFSVFLFALIYRVQCKDIASCCTKIKIATNGDAIKHQSNRVGEYLLYGVLADRPIYKHARKEEYLFYLMSRNKGLWMVGPKPAQFNGGLAHRGDALCVEDVAKEQWKYTDGSAWHIDSLLTVSCLDSGSRPECVYNDGVQFLGGDLPEEFGGGGIQTSANSSGQCIEECEKRAGCQYWTWAHQDGVNCFLKFDKVETVRRPKFVSGSIPSACITHQNTQEQSVCTYEGIDFVGGDLLSIPATSVDDCRQQCTEQVSCKLFTFVPAENRGCYLKTEAVKAQAEENVISGAVASICEEFVLPHVPGDNSNSVYEKNEINGKFKILMEFREELNNPDSKEFKDLSGAMEKYLTEMLTSDPELNEQATFDVRVESFQPGSVVCNFKVNYILKEAYLAIPFAIQPSNVTDSLGNSFKFKKGILFQRFLIAAGSFKGSSPVDHCAEKGCSHKCNYDYEAEDYICTCPPNLVLDTDSKTCIESEDAEKEEKEETEEKTTIEPEISVSLLPTFCLWSPWSDWSACSCDKKSERTRTIAIPAKNGGLCSGKYREVVDCESSEPCQENTEEVTETITEEDAVTDSFGVRIAEPIEDTEAVTVTEQSTEQSSGEKVNSEFFTFILYIYIKIVVKKFNAQ